jgi:signal transduction histidine kinase
MLRDFIAANESEILEEARLRVASRGASGALDADLADGLPVFLEQLREGLRKASAHEDEDDHQEIERSASRHGGRLFRRGRTAAEVVHEYSGLCHVIAALAIERGTPIEAREFQTLNRCLEEAIAGAVTAHGNERERAASSEETERLGVLAHEMRNIVNTAMLSFSIIRRGAVGAGGSTSAIHERSLIQLNGLIDRSLAEVRLDAGMQNSERLAMRAIIEEVAIGASLFAQTRGIVFAIRPVDPAIFVDADRQILSAAITNLVQNAFKFTRRGSTVDLRTVATANRVLIDVEDECGGLRLEQPETLLRPFVQRGVDRTGLGLGLSICVKAIKASKGELRIRNLPGKGCVFTIDLPKQSPLADHTELRGGLVD